MNGGAALERIVCLSAEAADWLWRIGAWEQVAGVTAFFSAPVEAAAKPKVSGFSTAKLDEIEKLKPDLIVGFSNVQAGFMGEAMRRGLNVLGTNQQTLAEIETTLALLGRVVGREAEAQRHLQEFRERLKPVSKADRRPRVYFEEWNEPLIAGIAWVSELIERAGGSDVFRELRPKASAQERSVSPEEIRLRNPEVIFASWCGRPLRIDEIRSRPGWDMLDAIRNERIFEIPGEDVLQPGFRLVHGYERIKQALAALL
jgi:iron complex transport system substrate-binding protein